MATLPLKTARLTLVPGDAGLLAAELAGRSTLGRELAAIIPGAWPPDLYDRNAMEATAQHLRDHPEAPGWLLWYLLSREESDGVPVVVGITGFKGLPSEDGTVEIGYSIVRTYRSRGYASEAVSGLIDWAFSCPAVQRIVAETYPELTASIRVMEKNGMQFVGAGSEMTILRYELKRSDWRSGGGAG